MHAPLDESRAATRKTTSAMKKTAARSELATFALCAGLLALAGGVAWWSLSGGGAAAQQKGQMQRPVAVFVAQAVRKDMPYRLEALGTVQPVVSVAVRSRVESQVEKVHFQDGATVKEGDLLFTLDSRAIEAQIRQAEATLSRDRAQHEKAQRDVDRIAGLVDRNVSSQVQLADARTNAEVLAATVEQNEALLQNLRVQRTYYEIRSPTTGRIGLPGVRPGAVVRSSDAAAPLATINQLAPIYVAFGLPERYLGDLRTAGDKAGVEVALQSEVTVTGGRVAFIDNAVDPQTATIMVRAIFDNKDERLWPGTLASVRVTLRTDANVVVVPTEAVQSGQRGTFVFVVEGGVAKVRPVTVARTLDGESVLSSGLAGGETVVTDGQLSLRDGGRVDIKRPPGG